MGKLKWPQEYHINVGSLIEENPGQVSPALKEGGCSELKKVKVSTLSEEWSDSLDMGLQVTGLVREIFKRCLCW